MKRFFDQPITKWRQLERCLHFYALPVGESTIIEGTRRPAAALGKLPGIGIQPPQYLHVTLQRLDAYEEDLSSPQWRRLLNDAPVEMRAHESFNLRFEPPKPLSHAIEAVAHGGHEWSSLLTRLRRLTLTAGLPLSTLTPIPPAPHFTLAYCTDDREDEDAVESLNLSGAGPTMMRIEEVALVSVTQRPDAGVFTFDVLERWPLGDKLGQGQLASHQELKR